MKKIIIFFTIFFLFTLWTNAWSDQSYEKVDTLLDIFYVKLEKLVWDSKSKIEILYKLNIKIEKIKNKKPEISNENGI